MSLNLEQMLNRVVLSLGVVFQLIAMKVHMGQHTVELSRCKYCYNLLQDNFAIVFWLEPLDETYPVSRPNAQEKTNTSPSACVVTSISRWPFNS